MNPPPQVDLLSPLRWLARGWSDLRHNPGPGLAHGCVLAAFGALMMWVARDRFWLLAGAFSGFLIVAPILATGLYAVSRAHERGDKPGLLEVLALWRSGDGRLVRFGLLLALAGTGWVVTSAGLITLWSPVPIHKPADFLRHVVLRPELGLFEIWLLLGALLAAPVHASTVVALPLLMDTQLSVRRAVVESWRAVARHPAPVALWATFIVALISVGMAAWMLGLVVVLPLVGHASWHAYRDLQGNINRQAGG
jgi:uncharacterized membrane protein